MTASMSAIKVDVKRLEHGAGLELPAYESAAAAGMDLRAAVAAGGKARESPSFRLL